MKFIRKILLISLISFSLPKLTIAQEMLGISNSNFAGNMGMASNPSLFVGSPYLSEFNFISADIFVDNNYVYLKRRSSLIRKSIRGESVSQDRVLDYYTGNTKDAYGNVFLRGPSYIVNKDKYSWGFHTALRSNISASSVPLHLDKFIKEGFDYIPQQDIPYTSPAFRSAAMIWGELGGTFGKKIYEVRDRAELNAAVTLKAIAGFDAFFVNLNEFEYMVPSSDTLIVNNVTGKYGYAMSNGENETMKKPFKIRGWGGGLDIGLTYYRKKVHGSEDCNQTADNLKKYSYRLGFSIIDIGFVKFGKQSHVFSFENNSTVWPGIDTMKFYSMNFLDQSISNHLLGNPDGTTSGSKFSIFLPTAVSLQFDYCVRPKIYVNASLIQGIPLAKNSIVRPGQFALAARYEVRKWEVAMPLTFYQYVRPHLGFALRYRIFVIGTDRLGSYTGMWDTTGYDLFFGFKSNICERKKKGGKQPFCPVN